MPTVLAFADVVGFPGYMVGTDGSVWSFWKRSGRIGDTPHQLKPNIICSIKDRNRKCPHLMVGLSKAGKRYFIYVHLLILEAFISPCPPGMECRHIDGNGLNNWLDNLCWGTHVENCTDRDLHGTTAKGSRNGCAKLTEEDIPMIRQMRAAGFSQRMVGSFFGVSGAVINSIDHGDKWKHVP